MVLVDSSVWIRGLANRVPFITALDRLLAHDEVVGHDLVFGELLIGDRGGRLKLLDLYPRFTQAKTVPHAEVVAFARQHQLHGRGAGWIDIHLLASAVVEDVPLWTADGPLEELAAVFGIRYVP